MKKQKLNNKYGYKPNNFKLSLFASFSIPSVVDGVFYINAAIQIRIYQDLLQMDFKKVHYKLAEVKGRPVIIYNILNDKDSYLRKIYYQNSDDPVVTLITISRNLFFSEE